MEPENVQSGVIGDERAHEFDSTVKSIWRVFWILLIVTSVEVGFAFLHYFTEFPPRMLLNTIFLSLTMVKAFYIVAEFMHLRHEIKNLILSVMVPLILFIWFIVAFLSDGNSWKNMKMHDSYYEQVDPGMSHSAHP
ncbi:MAG: cytochrome C oxidase subunit IV family protein [Chitinophagaceae bacterium]